MSGLLSNCGERGLPSGRDERASLAGEPRPQGAQASGVAAPGLYSILNSCGAQA